MYAGHRQIAKLNIYSKAQIYRTVSNVLYLSMCMKHFPFYSFLWN